MMIASEARNGGLYNLPSLGGRPAYQKAECYGWNHSKQFILFLVFDQWSRRKIVALPPNMDIQVA